LERAEGEVMYGDLKMTFQLQCLQEYNASVIATMKILAKRLGIGVTDDAINSLAYRAYQRGAGASSQLSFLQYLRMVDMGVGRGHPLGGLRSTRINLQASKGGGLAQVKDNIRKPKKIYSKVAYGKLTYLQNKLLHGYTEEAIAMLKQQMQNGTTAN